MRISLRAFVTALSLTLTMALPTHSGEGTTMAWTRFGQSGAGLVLGIAGAYLGSAAGKAMDPCNEEGNDESAFDLCNSSGATMGAIGGYLLGTTAGIYGTGRLSGRQGSPWMTASGAALGLLAGGLLSTQLDGSPTLQVMSLLALSQGLALFGYHWTDRILVNAGLETMQRKTVHSGAASKLDLALRPEVEVTLARF